MEVFYLQNLELDWDNVVSVATSAQRCIEEYTWGDVILETEQEVNDYLKTNTHLKIGSTFLIK